MSRFRRDDPIPAGGLVEHTYTTIFARFGVWEPVFMTMLLKAYGVETVPQRFHDIAMRKKLEIENERRAREAIAACECGCNA